MLGERIRRRLDEQGMTVAELAEKVGIARPMLYRYISGKHEPSASILRKIAEALCCTVDWFFTDPFAELKNPAIKALFEKSSDLTDTERTEVLRFIDFVKQKRAGQRKCT